jgi:hypothetical protein
VEVLLHEFLILEFDEGERLASHPSCFTPYLGTYWIRGWEGLRADVDSVEKITIHSPTRTQTPVPGLFSL